MHKLFKPPENSLAGIIGNVDNRLKDIEHATQAQWIDWLNYNPSEFSIGDNYISYTTSAESKFNVGNKIRIRNAEEDEYTYLTIAAVVDEKIYVDRPADLPVGIQAIGISKIESPVGWPGYHELEMVFSGSGITVDTGLASMYYMLLGRRLTLFPSTMSNFTITAGSGPVITMSHAFNNDALNDTIVNFIVPYQKVSIIFLPTIGDPSVIEAIISSLVPTELDFERLDGFDWSDTGIYNIVSMIELILV